MGDLIGSEVSGTLRFVPLRELERIRELRVDRFERAALFADACRLNALTMIARAGSGHIGSSFSSLDIVSWLHLEELGATHAGSADALYFSSKGHDAPGLYAVLIGLSRLPFEQLHALRKLDGLPGHPDISTPGIVTNTGSLGMGVSKAKGLALAARLRGERQRVYVLTGDGELQEGQLWESLGSAVNWGLSELTVIVDHNKLQSDTFVEKTSALGDLAAKFRSFGFHVERENGHDLRALAAALKRTQAVLDRPQVIIADTVKGAGVSFMEHTALDSDTALYRFHSGAPEAAVYGRAVEELGARLRQRTERLGIEELCLESSERPALAVASNSNQRLIPAYADALVAQMERTPNLVVLDADLCVDTGQLPARERFPSRFFECGIAEMDMVSLAGGLALRGVVPICHSFACFLSTRANEQIYNNATERTKIVYSISLAGLLPAGPGHSHQSLRDISVLASVPNLTLLAPSCAEEVALALAWCVGENGGSSALRLESVPCEVPYRLPDGYEMREGVGVTLREGSDALFIGYGPVLLSEAFRACERLQVDHGLRVGLVNLPWLNRVDRSFLVRAVARASHVFCLDNHYVAGGQGQMLAAAIASAGFERPPRIELFGVEGLPACGGNADVLRRHRLDAGSLVERVRAAVSEHAR